MKLRVDINKSTYRYPDDQKCSSESSSSLFRVFKLYQTWSKVEEIWLNVKSEIFYNPLVKTPKIQFSMNICVWLWIRNAIKSYSKHFLISRPVSIGSQIISRSRSQIKSSNSLALMMSVSSGLRYSGKAVSTTGVRSNTCVWFMSFGKSVECLNWCWMSNVCYCYLF